MWLTIRKLPVCVGCSPGLMVAAKSRPTRKYRSKVGAAAREAASGGVEGEDAAGGGDDDACKCHICQTVFPFILPLAVDFRPTCQVCRTRRTAPWRCHVCKYTFPGDHVRHKTNGKRSCVRCFHASNRVFATTGGGKEMLEGHNEHQVGCVCVCMCVCVCVWCRGTICECMVCWLMGV